MTNGLEKNQMIKQKSDNEKEKKSDDRKEKEFVDIQLMPLIEGDQNF